jgi:excinuclease ABC subunit C
MSTLVLPLGDLAKLHHRVKALAENRPAVYRMVDPTGRVVYVGKARRLRQRLLSYFRAEHPEKPARILQAAADIEWDYKPSEFAASLGELRQIKRHKPVLNVQMNRRRRVAFIKLFGGPAPKLAVGNSPGDDARVYGPFLGMTNLRDSLRILNDLLGLRDCALDTAIAFAEQGDLFHGLRRAGCLRHELGTCTGPCAGFVTEAEYRRRVATAVAFIEGRATDPLDHVITEMLGASERRDFERAQRWRDRFEALTWLLGACVRAHESVEALTFVYVDPGVFGDDRAYVIRRGVVRAAAPAPETPIEHEAFRAVVAEHLPERKAPGPLPPDDIDEVLLVMRWFRRHTRALRRAVSLQDWLAREPAQAAC